MFYRKIRRRRKIFLLEGQRLPEQEPTAAWGRLPKACEHAVPTVQPRPRSPTGQDRLNYCLNHSAQVSAILDLGSGAGDVAILVAWVVSHSGEVRTRPVGRSLMNSRLGN